MRLRENPSLRLSSCNTREYGHTDGGTDRQTDTPHLWK